MPPGAAPPTYGIPDPQQLLFQWRTVSTNPRNSHGNKDGPIKRRPLHCLSRTRTIGLDNSKTLHNIMVALHLHVTSSLSRPRTTREFPAADLFLPPNHQVHYEIIKRTGVFPGHHGHPGWNNYHLCTKPTDSCHPKHCTMSILHSLNLRNCSRKEDFT